MISSLHNKQGGDMNCIFCQIVAGKIPAKITYQDKHLIVFDNINPQAPIHKLIIPKKHIATFNDIGDMELLMHIMMISKNVARDLEIATTGYRLIINCNQNGGQEVYHLHLHLLGGRKLEWPPG